MSNFRGRRVTEPTPVIRAPPNTDFYHDTSTLSVHTRRHHHLPRSYYDRNRRLDCLAQAWDSMGKAKSVLRRVEHRLEDARRPSPTSFEEREKETCISMDEKSTKVKNENSFNKSHPRHKDKQSLRKISRLDDKFKDDYIYTRSRSPLASLNYDRHFVRNESRTLTPTMHLNDDHNRSITPPKHVNFIEKPEFHEIESRTRSYLDQNSNMSGKRYGHGSGFDKTYETEPYGAYAADDSIADTPVGAAREPEINFLNDNLHLNTNRDFDLGLEPGSRGLDRDDFPKLGSYNAASLLRGSERRTKTPSPYMLEGGAFDHYGCAYTGSMDDMDIVAPGRRIKKGIKDLGKDSDGLARIKELIDEQRRNMSSPQAELESHKEEEEEAELLAKVRHQESDAVMLNSYDAWEQPAGQPLSRKIAAGPPAPSYKGFNEVETKIRTPEGRVVKVPSHRRKTKKVDRAKEKPKTKATEKEPPLPQIAQAMSPLDDTPIKENQPKKSARVLATKKPSKFERKDIITTKSWREGQKLIRRELGPLPKPSVGKKKDNKSMDDSQEFEEPVAKPWDRDDNDDDNDKHGADEIPKQPEPRPILSEPGPILSEEAKDVLHDLGLGSDSEHSDDPHDHDGADKSRRKHTMKRKAPTSEVPSKKEPIAKVRHYDSDEVRRYIQKQQNERKKRQEEEKRAQKEAEENRQKQLQDLYKRARSKTTKTKPRNRPGNETRLDETFSKGPAPELSKRHPFHEDRPSMGVSGSDKENFDSKKVEAGQLWNKDEEDDSDTLTEESDGELTPRASAGKEGLKPAIPESEPMQLEDLMDRFTSSQAAAAAPEQPAADAAKPRDTQQNTQEIPSNDLPTSAPAVTTSAPTSTVNQRPLTAFDSTTALPASYSTRPYSALYPEIGQNRTRADRLQALHNTAASLQNRLDSETHRLTADANILPRRSPLDPTFGPSRDAWGYSQPDDSVPFVSRHDKIAGTHDDYSVFNRDLPGVGNLANRAQVIEGDRERNDAATAIQAAYRGHTVRQSMDWKMPSGSPMRSSLRKDVHLEPRALTSSMDRYNDSDVTESLDESDSDYINRRIGAALFSKDYCASNTEIKRSPVEFTQVPSHRHLRSSKPRYMWEEKRADPFSIYNIHTRRLQQQNEQGNPRSSPQEFYTRETVAPRLTAPENYKYSSLPGQEQPSSSTLTSISPHGIDGDTPRNPDVPNLPLDKKDDGSLSQPRTQSFQQRSHSAAYEDDFTGDESTLSISENTISGTSPVQTKEKTKSLTKSTHSKKPDSLDSELSSLVDDHAKPIPAPRRSEQPRPERDTQFRPINREMPREYHMQRDNIRPIQQGRLSPGSLERKLAAELNLLEGMEESVRQLTDVERTRAVSLAQQETVTLAQILKGRQQTHDQEMAALQQKARQESLEATQQLNQARQNTVSAEDRANRTVTQVRQEATTTLQDSTAKLLETQAAAAMTTAEAARQLAEAKNVILNHPAAVPTEQTLKMATDVASAAATAAVQATLAKHEKPPLPRSTKRAPSKDVSEVISSAASSDLSRSLAAPYSTESFESESTDSKSTLGRRRPRTPEPASDSVHTALDDSGERTPKADDSTIKTDPGADADKTESISEDLASEKDYSFSFDETMTEDEIEEHSFRAVLPSEGHRRRAKKDCKGDVKVKEADPISVSSDDVTLTNTNLNIDNVTGPFTHEESFKKFTAAMVRQYMKEEEIRSQHQAALLKLREKALKEKTKAELDWLEQQKKHHREKGADDIYPQIKKKQRGLMLKLQQEQAEIKRLREASRVASKERQLMLYQQQEIQRLRQSAAQVRDKLKKDNGPVDDFSLSVSEVNTEDEISIGFDDHSEMRSPSPKSKDYKSDSEVNSQQERSRSRSPDAKVMRNIKKMKADPKYLTAREKKLAQRRRQAEELLKWKKRLDKEEKAVYNLEVEAINVWDKTGKAKGKTPEKEAKKETKDVAKAPESAASETLISASDASKSMSFTGKPLPAKKSKPAERTESESSIVEDISGHWQASASLVPEVLSVQSKSVKFEEKPIQSGSESSVFEDVHTASQSSSIGEDLPTVTKSSKPRTQDSGDDTLITSNHSVREEYSNDTFVSGDTTTVPGAKPPLKSPVQARVSRSLFPSDKSLTPRSPRSPKSAFHPKKKGSESESEDSFSYTQSETASISDASDIEGRIRALNEDLKRRKSEADRLKKEQKKRHKDRLKAQEASLKKQIEAYDNFISQVKTDLQKELELEPTKVAVKPQIKHPNADQKRKRTTPVTTKSMPPEGFQRSDSESSSNRSSIDESRGGISESYTPFSPSLSITAPDDSLRKSSPSPRRPGALPPIGRKPKSDSDNERTPSRSSALNGDSQRTPPTLREVKDRSEISTKRDVSQSELVDEIPEDVSLSQKSEKSDGSEFRPLKLDDLASTKSEISEHVPSRRADTESSYSATAEKSDKGESSVSEMLPTKTDKTANAVTDASEGRKEKTGSVMESEKKDEESIISEAIPTAVDDSLPPSTYKSELKLDLKLDTKPVVEFRAPDSARTIGDVVTDIPDEFSQHSIGADLKLKEDEDKTDQILTARSHRSESDLWDYVETHPEDEPPKGQSQTSQKNEKIENDISSVQSDKSSKSYVSTNSYHTRTYSDDFSDDFSDVSADRRSETSVRDSRKEAALSDDDISEHLSYRSEFSERSASEPKALDLSDGSLKLNLKDVEGDDDRTPIQSPAPRSITSPFESLVTSTPTPEEDPLAHINIGDSVIVAGIERGTLKFKGLTMFAPGHWAGVELEIAEGTNDGSKDGVRYFDCKPKHGLFAPPDKVTYEPEVQKEQEDAPSDTSDHTLTEEPIDIPSVSEKSEKITEEGKPLFSPRSVLDDSTTDISISSDLERAITSAQAAVEGFGDGQKVPEKVVETEGRKPKKDMNKIVDSITDNLTEMVVKDSVLVMGDIVAKSPSKMLDEKPGEEPKVAAPAAEKKSHEVTPAENKEEVPENNVNNAADTATRNMLNDAISHMLTVRQNQISRSSESSQDDDGTDSGIPFDEYKDDRKSTPANSQTSIDTPESAFDNKLTPEDKITPEKKDLLIPKEDALIPPVRPVSPVFGEPAAKSVNQLNHDEVNARLEALNRMDRELMDGHLLGLGDQEWFDDDYGLSAQAQIPDHPPPPYPGSPPQHPQGVRHDISKLELQRLTEEVFYAVPHKDAEVKGIISEVVDVFWERRRYGEPLDDVEPPMEFLTKDDKGQDIETNSRRVYKKLIFDLVAEHIREMYKDEEEVEPPPWAKSKRLTNKLYRGVSPPTTSESLKDLLSDRMMIMLGLKENQKESKVTRWSGRKKKDHVDEILVQELREEEPQWVNYDDDELAVKMQLTDAIFDLLLNETVTVFSQIQTKLDARVE
ncbi:centrosome-associated protein 350-like isoform X3 [Lineus longissimus]|uniref:centrosome-associated protein 350-like isoform X3 n=1 Tax=Lineus longissimus TaxID=88925 RepID=UPI00315D4610